MSIPGAPKRGRPRKVSIELPKLTEAQKAIEASTAKYKCVRAGRRGGKTTYGTRKAIKAMFAGKRVFIASPSQKQVDAFWSKAMDWLYDAVQSGAVYKNESRRTIRYYKNGQVFGEIECRTARYPDELRGGYGDLILLDEAFMLDPLALEDVIMPMLLDNDGDLELYSTPKAGSWFNDLCQDIQEGRKPNWEEFYFTSHDNPHLSKRALEMLKENVSERAYEEEILALLLDEVHGALWKRDWIERYGTATLEKTDLLARLRRVVIAVDPAVSTNRKSDETGIVVVGELAEKDHHGNQHFIVLADLSGKYTPLEWANVVRQAYTDYQADRVICERNNGGDLVERNLQLAGYSFLPITTVWASRGKIARAEPIANLYENKRVRHWKIYPQLEKQMTTWTPDSDYSPDRLEAMVWALWALNNPVSGIKVGTLPR